VARFGFRLVPSLGGAPAERHHSGVDFIDSQSNDLSASATRGESAVRNHFAHSALGYAEVGGGLIEGEVAAVYTTGAVRWNKIV
jgi:hypothetical protein